MDKILGVIPEMPVGIYPGIVGTMAAGLVIVREISDYSYDFRHSSQRQFN